jgi:hypothetical protein
MELRKSCGDRLYRSWLNIIKHYMQWVVAGLLRDSVASVRATEHPPHRNYVNSMCNILYGINVILFHDIPGTKTCTCAYVTHSSGRFCASRLNDTQ